MKNKVGYLGLIFIIIFGILFVIVYYDIYFVEPINWISSEFILILLLLSIIFGCFGLLLSFSYRIKEYFIKYKNAKCKHCGHRNRISALYCDKCGEKL